MDKGSDTSVDPEWVETTGYGLYKSHPKRREKILRITKTLVVTEFGRYDKKTGMNLDATNKSIGGYKLAKDKSA